MEDKLINKIFMSNNTYMALINQPDSVIKMTNLFDISIEIDNSLPLGKMETNIEREN